MSNEKLKRRRAKLHARDPQCHWCRTPTVLIEGHVRHKPANMATIDHLDDRFSPLRGTMGGQERTVLACDACNNRRGQERQRAVVDVQRAKSMLGRADKAMHQLRQSDRTDVPAGTRRA